MAKEIDYYLTPISPWAFLGAARFRTLVEAQHVEVRVKPVKIAEVFKRTGGLPLGQRSEARQAYRLQELERWRKRRKIKLNMHPAFFPAPDGLACRFLLAAEAIGGDPLRLAEAMGEAVWVKERNIADTATLQDLAEATGHNRITILAKAIEPTMEAKLDELTEEAIAKGVFGAPTYVYGDRLFWGQDRLPFLKEALEC